MKRGHDRSGVLLSGEQQSGELSSPSKRHAIADENIDTAQVHIEVYTTATSTAEPRYVEEQVLALLQRRAGAYVEGMRIDCDEQAESTLSNDVEAINVCEIESASVTEAGAESTSAPEVVPFARASHYVHISQLCDEDATVSDLDMGGGDGSDVPACQQYSLPAREFHGVWESLVFDTAIKQELLAYAQTAMLFADRGVDTNLVAFNRVILLHGPPGTVSSRSSLLGTAPPYCDAYGTVNVCAPSVATGSCTKEHCTSSRHRTEAPQGSAVA